MDNEWDAVRQKEEDLHFRMADKLTSEANANEYWTRNTLIAVNSLILTLSLPVYFNADIAYLNRCLMVISWGLLLISVVFGLISSSAIQKYFLKQAEVAGKVGAIFGESTVASRKEVEDLLNRKKKVFNDGGFPESGRLAGSKVAKYAFDLQKVLSIMGVLVFILAIASSRP